MIAIVAMILIGKRDDEAIVDEELFMRKGSFCKTLDSNIGESSSSILFDPF
jgi:hypothetical protein